MSLPEFLASGERARLIPVIAETSREGRATSVFLATLAAVKPYAAELLQGIGVKVGQRSNVACYTEVVFKKLPPNLNCRPDGLILVRGPGDRVWSALLEAKIGRAQIDEQQISAYCQVAKTSGVDAVITLSNKFVALPTHPPIRLSKSDSRGIQLFHWSWMHVLTQAKLLLNDHQFESAHEREILSEVERFFAHPSTGISSFDRMNSEWKHVVLHVHSGGMLSKTGNDVENTVAAWHQESRDLCLLLSRKLSCNVKLQLTREHSRHPEKRLRHDCENLATTRQLCCWLSIPDAAAEISVVANLERRSITVSMIVPAPRDRKRNSSRFNWLLRQLSKTQQEGFYVRAKWPGRIPDTQSTLAEFRDNPAILEAKNSSAVVHHFQILGVRDLAGKFSGSRTFIEQVEDIVPHFYEQVGQVVQAYVPRPPKVRKFESDAPETAAPQPGELQPAEENPDPITPQTDPHVGRPEDPHPHPAGSLKIDE